MTLTKDQIVEKLRSQGEFSSHDAKRIIETLLEEIKVKLEAGDEVKISGFGKWAVRQKRSRPGRNPHTGEKIEITARRVVTFHPSDKLRSVVNGEAFEPTEKGTAGAIDTSLDG